MFRRLSLVAIALLLAVLAAGLAGAQEIRRGTLKKLDIGNRTVVVTTGGTDHELTLTDDTQVPGGRGKNLAEKFRAFREGADVEFKALARDGKQIVQGIRPAKSGKDAQTRVSRGGDRPQRGKLKEIDLAGKTITLTVGEKDLTLAVTEQTDIRGTRGDTLTDRLVGLEPGIDVMFLAVDRDGGRVLVRLIPDGAARGIAGTGSRKDIAASDNTSPKPLNEAGSGKYRDYRGGLSVNGQDAPPKEREVAGRNPANRIQPLEQGNSGTAKRLNATSPLGTNLGRVNDYSEEWVFVDAFRASRPWVSSTSSDQRDSRTLNLDPNGWVASLEPNQVARTLLLSAKYPYPAGNYVVLYEGEGTIQYGGAAIFDSVLSRPGRHVLRMESARKGISMLLTATNPRSPIRNIRVIMPGGICAGDPFGYAKDAAACAGAGNFLSFEANYATIVFHPKFLERIRAYRAIRFIDWSRVSNSKQSTWSDRPKLSDAQWSTEKGVPIEVMVELANRISADAWFTLPHQADDNYVRQYAVLVNRLLRRDLKAYLEYSNEVWNGIFSQAAYARAQGLALGLSTNPMQAQLFFYSRRSVQIFDIWAREIGDPARLVRVMAAHAANPWSSAQVLDFERASEKTDALAIAPYFRAALRSPDQKNRYEAMNLDALFTELQKEALPMTIESMKRQAAVAKANRLPLIAYEGGQHLVGAGGTMNSAAINSLFDRANRDPRMGELYRRYLASWKASGGTMMVHYMNCSEYGKFGRWGALEYLDQPRADSPKFDALHSFIERNPAWW